MDKQPKPLKNIANVLGRTDIAKRLVKTEAVVSVYPPEIRKFEKGTSIISCPNMENEGSSVDVLRAKVSSVGSGNDFENFGHSQIYRPKNDDTTLLFGVDRSDDVTLPNVTTDVQGLMAQDFAKNIDTDCKFEEAVPSSLNITKCEEDSSLGITVKIASVETKEDGKNTVNCDCEIDKINVNCVSPTPLTVLELADSMPADQEISRKYSLNSRISEKLEADSFLKTCKMEAGFCENLSLQDVEEHVSENKPINYCLTNLTSDEKILNNVEDSNGPIKDECVAVHSNCHTEVESVITLVEVDDNYSNFKTTGIHLKTQQISYDSLPDKNERTNYDVPCPSMESDIGNELSALNCPEQKTVECDRRAKIKNEILVECEAEVNALKTQCEFYDEQNFRTEGQQCIDLPNNKNARSHSIVSCPPKVSDVGNDLPGMNCCDQKMGVCDIKVEIKNEILAESEEEITCLKTLCELSDEQIFNTKVKKDTVLSSKADCLEDIKCTELGTSVLENVRNHDTTFNEAKNNEKFKSLSERDELSPWKWRRQVMSSTPCQIFSKIMQEDDGSNACQILSTPKTKRNVNIDTTKGKKIDFTEIVEDQSKDCFVENLEKLPMNQLENAKACNENVKTVLNIKQEQETPLKLSENFSDDESMQSKGPATPDSQGIKMAKFYSNENTIIDVEAESEVQKQMKVDKNPLKLSETFSDIKSMQVKKSTSPESLEIKKAKHCSNKNTIIDVIDVEAENEVQKQMKVDKNPVKLSETFSDIKSMQVKKSTSPESLEIKKAKHCSNKNTIIDVIDVEAENEVQKQMKVDKNPVKLSETFSDNKSMQVKRPTSPESLEIKKAKPCSNKNTFIDVEAENEVQKQMKVGKNPVKLSETFSDNKSMQVKRPTSPESLEIKKAKPCSNKNTFIDVEAENEVQKQMKVGKNPVKLSETFSDNKSMQMKRPASPESLGIKKAKFYSNKNTFIDVGTENEFRRQMKVDKITRSAKFQNTNFVSKDPQENEDNNNPEWEVLKKLETDDERYKAVRKRWRNLVIPDPNKNLTCIHMKSSFKHPNLCRHGGDKISNENANRKRTHSHEPTTSTDHVPVKRARTRSCTTSYELKVKDCYKKLEEESKKLSEEKRHALANTSNYYYRQYSNLMASNLRYYNNWEFQTRIAALSAAERRAEETVHQDYSGAFDRLENEKRRQALVFENAMKEVEAFHKFYRKLEDSSKNDCFFLTDVELDDVKATDKLYERFNTFYS